MHTATRPPNNPRPHPGNAPKSLFARTLTALFSGALIILGLAGCATGTQKTSPLWDDRSGVIRGPDEDRINVWPLLYWSDPALSIMWPLYTRTDEGHALVPAYEYTHDDRRLRIGTVHPDLVPVVADFNGADDRWRVLNVVHDRRENRRRVYPVYFQNYSANNPSTFLVPVYYRDNNGYWTPLITRRDNITGVLGPLFHRRESRNQVTWALPWPIVSITPGESRGEIRVFPLFGHRWTPHGEDLHVGWMLYRYESSPQMERRAVLWRAAQWWESGDGASGSHVFPFYYTRYDTEAGMRRIYSPLVSWHDDGSLTNVAGFLYHRREKDEKTTGAYLIPFGHWWEHESSSGSMLIPFYLRRADHETGVNSFYSPLVSWRDDGSLRNVGVIFHHVQDQDGRRSASVLWPMIRWWKGPDDDRGSNVIPFYYRDVKGDNRLLATLVGGFYITPTQDTRTVLGPVYFSHSNHGNQKEYTTYAWPIWQSGRDGDANWRALLPLYFQRTHGDETFFVSAPYTRRTGEEALSQSLLLGAVGWGYDNPRNRRHHRVFPLYWWEQDGSKTKTNALIGLAGWSRDTENNHRSHRLIPFYEWEKDNDQRKFSLGMRILMGSRATLRRRDELEKAMIESLPVPNGSAGSRRAWTFQSGATRRLEQSVRERTWLISWFRSSNTLVANAKWIGNETFDDWERVAAETDPENLWQIEFEEQERVLWWPFYRRDVDGDREARREILWRLYDSHSQTTANDEFYARRRVLWRLWRQETYDSHVSTDIFPFVSTDRNREKDHFRWSFAGGLLGMHREGVSRRYRLLYFTFGDRS